MSLCDMSQLKIKEMSEIETVTIKMYLHNIDTIYKKDMGTKYYELTYRSVDGLRCTIEVINPSEIKEHILFNVKINK